MRLRKYLHFEDTMFYIGAVIGTVTSQQVNSTGANCTQFKNTHTS